MTDGNLTVKCGFITWGMWVVAAILIVVDAAMMWAGAALRVGPLGNVGIYIAAAAATWTACACMRAVGRQLLAELVRARRERAAEHDRVHVLQ